MLNGASGVARVKASANPKKTVQQETGNSRRENQSGELRIATQRRGVHHMVEGHVSGPGGTPVQVMFLVDTGASSVVLPKSLMEPLGYDTTHTRPGLAQTARGTVKMRVATLDRILVGEGGMTAELEDVQVAFVEDKFLGGMALLGMSFLGRYRVTFDDDNNEILLVEKP